MRPIKTLVAILLLMSLTVSPRAKAEFKCDGAACKDVKLWFENGCHQAKNMGSRKIQIKRGAFGKVLAPGETWQVRNLDGSCLEKFVGSTTAEYVE